MGKHILVASLLEWGSVFFPRTLSHNFCHQMFVLRGNYDGWACQVPLLLKAIFHFLKATLTAFNFWVSPLSQPLIPYHWIHLGTNILTMEVSICEVHHQWQYLKSSVVSTDLVAVPGGDPSLGIPWDSFFILSFSFSLGDCPSVCILMKKRTPALTPGSRKFN